MKKIFGLLFLFFTILAQAQNISGIIHDKFMNPVVDAEVRLIYPLGEFVTKTNENGIFSYANPKSAYYVLYVNKDGYTEHNQDINYISGEDINLNILLTSIASKSRLEDIPVIEQSDESSPNDNLAVSSLLNASNDLYLFHSNFNFFQFRYRNRGYENFGDEIRLNHLNFENLFRGSVSFSEFSGLNDVMRSRSTYYGIRAIPFTFGNLSTNNLVDMEAVNQRKGTRITLSRMNRNFQNRISAVHNFGYIPKYGIHATIAGNYRQANSGYIQGTPYESYSLFGSVSKLIRKDLLLTLSAFTVNTTRGAATDATREQMDLWGDNYYNPNFGFQNGEARNANIRRDKTNHFILSSNYELDKKTSIKFNVGYKFGEHSSSRLDWFNATNPYPNFYKNLPSYEENESLRTSMIESFKNNPEDNMLINWASLYNANRGYRSQIPNSTDSGYQAVYIQSRDVNKISELNANLLITRNMTSKIQLTLGLNFQNTLSENFRQIDDLLGSDYALNVNYFAQMDAPDNREVILNDVNTGAVPKYRGDRYGYNYMSRASSGNAWLQGVFKFDQIDVFAAYMYSHTQYQRNGFYRVGGFTNTSFGNSEIPSFDNHRGKLGMTYKFNGRNYLQGGLWVGYYGQEYQNVFYNERSTNNYNKDLSNVLAKSFDFTYNYKSPKFKLQATFFYTETENDRESVLFYNEQINTFGKYLITEINKRNQGVEVAAEYNIGRGFTASFAGTYMDNIYTNRPKAQFFNFNSDNAEAPEDLYYQYLKQASGPQELYMLKLNYSSPQFWSASVSLNHMARNYVFLSPQRRTKSALDEVEYRSDLYYSILRQEEMPAAWTVDLFLRKSFYLNKMFSFKSKNRYYVDFSLSVNNLLDNQNVMIGGREQFRFDFNERNPERFPIRYTHMMGINYAFTANFRF
ncbi:MAG: hypothetical protein MUE53_05645 [Chitinophagales bacterium]|jgi:hypothetical protein|nr:hypothetical protein [Chitinophagales bacterium]